MVQHISRFLSTSVVCLGKDKIVKAVKDHLFKLKHCLQAALFPLSFPEKGLCECNFHFRCKKKGKTIC